MLYLPVGHGRPPLTTAGPTAIDHTAAHPTVGGVPSMDYRPSSANSHPGLKGGGTLGDASTPGTPAGSIAVNAHGGTYSLVAVAWGTWGGERGAADATAAAAARRRRATPTGGAVTPPRSAPAHGGHGGWRTGGRVGPTTARRGASGHRGRVETRKSRRAVARRNSGRWGVTGGQAPSGPCDPCGRTFLLRHVTPFAVIAAPRTLSWGKETATDGE